MAFNKKKRKIAELEEVVANLQFEKKGLQEQVEIKQNAIEKLSNINDSYEANIKQLKSQNELLQSEKEAMIQSCTDLQTELKAEKESKESFEKLCREKAEEIDDLKKQLAEAEKQIETQRKKPGKQGSTKKSTPAARKDYSDLYEIIHTSPKLAASYQEKTEAEARGSKEASIQSQALEPEESVASKKHKSKRIFPRFGKKSKPKGKTEASPRKHPKLFSKKLKFGKLRTKTKHVPILEYQENPVSQHETGSGQGKEQQIIQQMEDSASRSLAVLHDTEQISIGILENMGEQQEQLNRAEQTHSDVPIKESPPKQKRSHKLKLSFRRRKRSRASTMPPHTSRPETAQPAQTPPPIRLEDLPSTGSEVVDSKLDEMSRVLHRLKIEAEETGRALDKQNKQRKSHKD